MASVSETDEVDFQGWHTPSPQPFPRLGAREQTPPPLLPRKGHRRLRVRITLDYHLSWYSMRADQFCTLKLASRLCSQLTLPKNRLNS